MSNFKLDIDADGIALITWDMPDRSMNVITMNVIDELGTVVDKVANDAAIKGAVITSGKSAFCGGADLTMLDRLAEVFATMAKKQGELAAAGMLYEESRKLSLLYRRIETCGKPWVCALNGTAMGGGFELALACHYRVASDDTKTRLGLPEIKIGLFPGAGGTQRVARSTGAKPTTTIRRRAPSSRSSMKGSNCRLTRHCVWNRAGSPRFCVRRKQPR